MDDAAKTDAAPGNAPALVMAAMLAFMVIALRGQGRIWRHGCGRILVWVGDAWSSHTSQHLFDPYSFTHVLHGLAFCGLLALAASKWSWQWRLGAALGLEAAWELFENSAFVINRYREATVALGYQGDSIVNSLGDIASCALGFVLARQLGWRRSVIFFIVTEAVLMWWIRDILTLNIIMLIYPLEALKVWQLGH
jgi:hypothetical protein